jgi:hypothetical protein
MPAEKVIVIANDEIGVLEVSEERQVDDNAEPQIDLTLQGIVLAVHEITEGIIHYRGKQEQHEVLFAAQIVEVHRKGRRKHDPEPEGVPGQDIDKIKNKEQPQELCRIEQHGLIGIV